MKDYLSRISIKVYVDNITLIIILATAGFFLLAAILLIPIYRFLLKEEKISEQWTAESIAASIENRHSPTNGDRSKDDPSANDRGGASIHDPSE